MISIGGTTIKTPSSFSVGVMDISKADRNANGSMIIERVTTKRKLELSYAYLSNTDLATLFALVSNSVFFTVVYPDPLTGAARSGTFYAGDRTAGCMDYKSGTPRWKDVKFNLIER